MKFPNSRGGVGVARSAAIGTMFRVRGAVDGRGILLLRATVVIPLLLAIAGDVKTNPGPEGNYCNIPINNTVWVFRTCMEIDFGCHINQV